MERRRYHVAFDNDQPDADFATEDEALAALLGVTVEQLLTPHGYGHLPGFVYPAPGGRIFKDGAAIIGGGADGGYIDFRTLPPGV